MTAPSILGETAKALELHTESQRLFGLLVNCFPDEPQFLNEYAVAINHEVNIKWKLGDLERAKDLSEATITVWEKLILLDERNLNYKYSLSATYNNLGGICLAQGDVDGAIENYTKRIELGERLIRENKVNIGLIQRQITNLINFATVLQEIGNFELSTSYIHCCLELAGRLQTFGSNFQSADVIADVHMSVGKIYEKAGELDLAMAQFKLQAAILNSRVQSQLTEIDIFCKHVRVNISISELLVSRQNFGQARRQLASSFQKVASSKEKVKSNPETLKVISELYNHSANIYFTEKNYDLASSHFQISADILELLPVDLFNSFNVQIGYSGIHARMGDTLMSLNDVPSAKDAFERALSILRRITGVRNIVSYQKALSATTGKLAELHFKNESFNTALDLALEMNEMDQTILKLSPMVVASSEKLAITKGVVGKIYFALGDIQLAEEYFEADVQIAESINHRFSNTYDYSYGLAIAYTKIGEVTSDNQRRREYFSKSYNILIGLSEEYPDSLEVQKYVAVLAKRLAFLNR